MNLSVNVAKNVVVKHVPRANAMMDVNVLIVAAEKNVSVNVKTVTVVNSYC
jgi:hypothetical protein